MELTSTLEPVRATVLLSILAIAVWQDVRNRRIDNRVTASGLVLGLGFAAVLGAPPLGAALAGAGIALALGIPLFAARLVGGGDVKLMVASAAFLGVGALPRALLLTALAGGAIALLQAARHRVLLPALLDARALIGSWVPGGGRSAAGVPAAGPQLTIPYGVAIATGVIGAWLAG